MDFWSYEYPTQRRLPLEVSAAECRKMRDLRQCKGEAMDALGSNKWSLEILPFLQASYWYTLEKSVYNCRLEEVVLETESPNSNISSPLGDIAPGTNGTITHNLVTLVWDNSYKEEQKCKIKKIEGGVAMLHSTTDPNIHRMRDSERQIDFLFSVNKTGYCNVPAGKSRFSPVMGMENVIIASKILDKTSDSFKPSDLKIASEKVATLLQSQVDTAAHTQYLRDLAVEMSNGLGREMRAIQCQARKLAHKNAVTTAQYNGWLAASYLDLPVFSKLFQVGN